MKFASYSACPNGRAFVKRWLVMNGATPVLRFALNHMVAPRLKPREFFDLCHRVGVSAVEIRNNLPRNAIADGTSPRVLKKIADDFNVSIVSINALSRFNDWGSERLEAAYQLADYAADCGAKGIVLVPENRGQLTTDPDAPHK